LYLIKNIRKKTTGI